MKLIVGLGNPDKKYQNTRHNIGYKIADAFVEKEGIFWKFDQDFMSFFAKNDQIVVCKPTTYMNKSGDAVRNIANFFKIDKHDILIIHDDLDLPFGKIRISFDSLSAGHKGIDSIIKSLSGMDFARLRFGIGSPRKASGEAGHPREKDLAKDPSSYVLEKFDKKEQGELPRLVDISITAIRSFLHEGVGATMNRFN